MGKPSSPNYPMDSVQQTGVTEKTNMFSELLQILAVLQWILTILLLGPVCVLLIICLVCSSLWPLLALYTIWMISEWNTPERGGRRCQWMSQLTIWKYFRDYFPVKLHKTADLDPNQNYIFGYHPHGIMSVGVFCNFLTESTGFSQLFPKLRPYVTTLAGNFKVPFYRDYLLAIGMCSVAHASIDYLLSHNGLGNAVVIVVGGASEALKCSKHHHILTLKNRKGFIRKALTTGSSLVPVYSFGENEVLHQYQFEAGSWIRSLQESFLHVVGFAPCIFFGRGIFSSSSRGIMPLRRAINTVVGKPIPVPKIENPSEQQVDTYHALYVSSLQELFDTHKQGFGLRQEESLILV
ncbi:diacylglycerol O-acyltransferase 2-like [Spea bombifrons]|uniref:diacylglycerol O-acyltransferase 2-like n=1 Tax=Spea bombifrons TaxID=233779 RepID=UPI0023492CCE|nr:diacylglycerol O-acyltransferase 2-like [Spea bombifrons]